MINRILVKTEPSMATKIEIRRFIDGYKARPVKQVQCPVCGSWKDRTEPCCDETEFTNSIQRDDDDIRTGAAHDCD